MVGPGHTVLAHLESPLKLGSGIAAAVRSRQGARLWGFDIDQWVNPGFDSYLTIKITNTYPRNSFIYKGKSYAQLVFYRVSPVEYTSLQVSPAVWKPEDMIPKGL